MRRGPKELWLYLWISGVGINPNLVSISIYERFRWMRSIISYLNVLSWCCCFDFDFRQYRSDLSVLQIIEYLKMYLLLCHYIYVLYRLCCNSVTDQQKYMAGLKYQTEDNIASQIAYKYLVYAEKQNIQIYKNNILKSLQYIIWLLKHRNYFSKSLNYIKKQILKHFKECPLLKTSLIRLH